MLPSPQKPPIWVNSNEALVQMTHDLALFSQLGVDTESNSLFAYREQVCLIQFSTPDEDYLADPLALGDLSPLGSIFENEKIEKIFHASEYDLICLKRNFQFKVNHIFDTMLAGRILGRKELGLATMLEFEFGNHLEKKFQRANWGQRPLSDEMKEYARLDTHYLLPLKAHLEELLKQSGRLELAREDFKRFAEMPVPEGPEPDMWWKVAGNHPLEPRQAGVLQELCRYREQQAQKMDLPLFKVLSNDALLQVALNCPRTRRQLTAIKDISPRLLNRHVRGLLDAVEIGLKTKAPPRPQRSRPNAEYLARLERLRTWRKEKAAQLGVESDVVLPRETLEMLAGRNPKTLDELNQALTDQPRRFKQFAKELLEKLAKPKVQEPEKQVALPQEKNP